MSGGVDHNYGAKGKTFGPQCPSAGEVQQSTFPYYPCGEDCDHSGENNGCNDNDEVMIMMMTTMMMMLS